MHSRFVTVVLIASLMLALAGCSAPASTPSSEATTTVEASATAGDSSQMAASNPKPETLLSVADVERVSGLSGLKLVAQNSSQDAVGRLNFANADGVLVATMNIGDGTAFDESMQGMFFSEVATGTGSMCFVGPSPEVSPVLSIFAAAQGDHAVIMRTFLKQEGGTETWIGIEKLQELVGLALGRWGG